MNRLPATLSYQQAIMPIDPGAVAAAETAKARIQSAYVMAMQRPRSEDQARARILEACKRPEFAERVEYSKPVGNQKIVGPSIRFAELAVREWGNVMTESSVVYEDDRVRRVKITILDLETNATFGKEIQVGKTVERKNAKGREIVAERTNSYNETVYIVLATDDELHNKEAAMISKVIRNEGLRLIPTDIVDEAVATARKTRNDRDAKDPKAAKKRVMDSFDALGIKPKEIEKYVGHGLDTLSAAELDDLRGVYQALKSGESTWAEYVQSAKAEASEAVADLNAKVAGEGKAPQGTKADDIECPDLEGSRPRSECERCAKRAGCPAHGE